MIRFVIPAYNEAENIPRLLADLAPVARELGARVIIVDDGSTDGTADVIREHSRDMHLAVVSHTVNRGLGTAINTGMRAALERVLRRRRDRHARGRHDLRPLRPAADAGALRAGDRRRPRLGLRARRQDRRRRRLAADWPANRSRTPSAYLGGLREMHTLSSLYRVYRAGTLRRAADTYGYLLVREPGFAANVELLLKLYNAGASVAEVPTVNDWSTRKGESKMQLKPTVRRLPPGDGRPHGRPHPAAAGLAAGRGDGALAGAAPGQAGTATSGRDGHGPSPRADERRRPARRHRRRRRPRRTRLPCAWPRPGPR